MIPAEETALLMIQPVNSATVMEGFAPRITAIGPVTNLFAVKTALLNAVAPAAPPYMYKKYLPN